MATSKFDIIIGHPLAGRSNPEPVVPLVRLSVHLTLLTVHVPLRLLIQNTGIR